VVPITPASTPNLCFPTKLTTAQKVRTATFPMAQKAAMPSRPTFQASLSQRLAVIRFDQQETVDLRQLKWQNHIRQKSFFWSNLISVVTLQLMVVGAIGFCLGSVLCLSMLRPHHAVDRIPSAGSP
jgi:hypothetical protein